MKNRAETRRATRNDRGVRTVRRRAGRGSATPSPADYATLGKTHVIRQVVFIKASPPRVYEALMDSRKHSRATGMRAVISGRVGGKFTAFEGGISGVNLSLEPNRRIVQSWRAYDWPQGHYSRVTFTLTRLKGGTRLTLTRARVPARHLAGIRRGWREYYWVPLRALLEG